MMNMLRWSRGYKWWRSAALVYIAAVIRDKDIRNKREKNHWLDLPSKRFEHLMANDSVMSKMKRKQCVLCELAASTFVTSARNLSVEYAHLGMLSTVCSWTCMAHRVDPPLGGHCCMENSQGQPAEHGELE